MKPKEHNTAYFDFRRIAITYLSLLFLTGIICFCCFHTCYFFFMEQLQVFRFDSLYWEEFLNLPGGVSAYIGNFFTQFFIFDYAGGIIICLFLAILLLLMYLFMHQAGYGWFYLPLAAISCITLFYCFTDMNTRTGLLVALLIVFIFLCLTGSIVRPAVRLWCTVILVPFVYWFTGAGVFIYVIVSGGNELKRNVHLSTVFPVVLCFVFAAAMPFIARHMLILSNYEAWTGVAFYTIPHMPLWNYLAIFSPAIIFVIIFLHQSVCTSTKKSEFFLVIATGILFAAGSYYKKWNAGQAELYCWDYHLKQGNWEQIIRMAEKSDHYDPLFVNMTNLALVKTGQLASGLFRFPQRADAARLWTSNYYPMLVTGEIYYQLDMPQVARSFFFMAQTQSPNGQSPFLYKRLAEIELLTDNEAMAGKYISSLSNTLFYSKQAREMQKMITEKQLSAEWMEKKKNQPSGPGFFATEFKYNLLVQYHEHPGNTVIRDYLLAQCILENDFNSFFRVLDKEESFLMKTDLPAVYQEFILMYAYMINDNSLARDYRIQPSVVKSFYDYLQVNQKRSSKEEKKEELQKTFGSTYWYYMQFINRIK